MTYYNFPNMWGIAHNQILLGKVGITGGFDAPHLPIQKVEGHNNIDVLTIGSGEDICLCQELLL